MIWLLNPPTPEKMFKEGRCQQKAELYQTNYPPLTLAYLAAILRKKFNVRIIDGSTKKYKEERILKDYKKEKPDIVFVNSTTPTIDSDIYFIKKLLKIKSCKIKLFGIHASFWESKYEDRNIEIAKEPEQIAYRLIKSKVPDSLDKLPFPAWDMVNLLPYKLPIIRKRFVLVQSSKGCPYECTFCTNPYYSGRKVKQRSVKSIIAELKYIKELGINHVIFFADTFTLNKKWVRELCREILKEKLEMFFSANSRVDTIDKTSLKLMKKAGFWLISLGIESGNQQVLGKAKKEATLEQAERAVKAAYDKNILTLGHFIIGLPGETKETALQTIKFSKKLPLDFAMFYIATPFPGSELYEMLKKKGKIRPINWENFEYSKKSVDTHLDLEGLRKKAYRSFYFSNKFKRVKRIFGVLGLRYSLGIIFSGISFINIYKKHNKIWQK